MKKWFFVSLHILLTTTVINAQFKENPILNKQNEDKKFLNYGYTLGLNQHDFKFEYKDNLGFDSSGKDLTNIQVVKSFGFNVGLIGEMRINKNLDLRFEPGLNYSTRLLGFPSPLLTEERDAIREVKSTYINFPILLKISANRFGNWKPFIIGGGSRSLNLSNNEASLDDNSMGTFRMKKWVYNYELGFGIDFYLEYFKFTPSIRGIFAITDELVPDNDPNSPWTGNIESMKTRGIFINFTFE